MSDKAFQLRVPAHLVARIKELMRRNGWATDNGSAVEGAARKLLAGAVQEAEIAGPELWLDPKS